MAEASFRAANADGVVQIYKNTHDRFPPVLGPSATFQILGRVVHGSVRSSKPSRSSELGETFPRHFSLAVARRRPVKRDPMVFRRAPHFGIPAQGSESRGRCRKASKKGISLRASLRVGASFAYSSWSARYVVAERTSPICEQAGGEGSAVSGPTETGPTACIATSTAWYTSSETSSVTTVPLHFSSQVRRNCAGSGLSCEETARTLPSVNGQKQRPSTRQYRLETEPPRALSVDRIWWRHTSRSQRPVRWAIGVNLVNRCSRDSRE
jgi:hypothetical protein